MDSGITEKINPDLRYIVLRASLNKYETAPYNLSTDKLEKIIRQAENEHHIQSKILSSKEAMDVIISEDAVNRAFQEICDRYENEEDFHSDMEKNSLDESQFRKALFRELKVETVLERVTSKSAMVSDIDVMIYYHMHQQKMKKPEVRKARHILITVNNELAENTYEKSLKKASELYERLKKKPKKFSELAMKFSECPTAFKGGELGSITQGVLYKELEDILFKMQEKQLSPVVESPLGFHILFCDEIQHAKTLSIAEATPAIRQLLEQRRKKVCQQTWLSKLLTGEKND